MSLLSAVYSAVDVVGVFDSNFRQLFPGARPLKARVREHSRLMEHPVETGVITSDHRIILPTEIELPVISQSADYMETYQEIKQVYLAATLLTVLTKTGAYPNMLILEMPHDESAEMFDAIAINIRFKQVIFANSLQSSAVQGPPYSPADPALSSTVQQGAVQSQSLALPLPDADSPRAALSVSAPGSPQAVQQQLTTITPAQAQQITDAINAGPPLTILKAP